MRNRLLGLTALTFVAATCVLAQTGSNNIYNIYNCKLNYGATGNGTTDDTVAIQTCINAVPSTGGEAFLPAGNYKISSTLVMGNGSNAAESTVFGISLKGAGDAGASSLTVQSAEWTGGTTLSWAGASNGIMLQVSGPTLNMRVSDLSLNGKGTAGTGLAIVHGNDTLVTNVSVTNFTIVAYHLTTTTNSTVTYGGCNVLMTKVRSWSPNNSTASGMLIDAPSGATFDVCSSKFIDLTLQYGGGAGSYGLNLGFTDSNMFKHVVFQAVETSTGGNSILFSPQTGHTTAPAGNSFDQVYTYEPIGGTSGTNGNLFENVPVSEGIAIPFMTNVTGITDHGEMFGPMSAIASKSDDSTPALVLETPDSSSNGAGVMYFKWGRFGSYRARIRANYFDGLVFGTANGSNPITDNWAVLPAGSFVPSASSVNDLGSASNLVRNLYLSGAVHVNTATGLSKTITIGACQLTFTGGILTASTC